MPGVKLPMFLAAACLLGAPGIGLAQTTSAIPMQTAPRLAPTRANSPPHPLAWSSLSAEQQRILAPVHGQWDELRPQRQHRLAHNATHWLTLPPARQQQIQERLTRWTELTPEQRRQLRENARVFRNLTPEERARVSAAFRKFQSLPPAERRALRERWRAMPPQQRLRWTTRHPNQPIPLRPPAQRGH